MSGPGDLVLGDLQPIQANESVDRPAEARSLVPGVPITGSSSPVIGQKPPATLSAESISALFMSLCRSLAQVDATLQTINTNVAAIVAGQVGSNLGSTDVGLPTSDPAIAGALWSDGGIVTVSSG